MNGPRIELPPLSSVEIELPGPAAAGPGTLEAWTDAQLERMRAQFVDLTPVDRAAQPGDFVRLDLRAGDDGEDAGRGEAGDRGRARDVHVELGSDLNPAELNEALVGLTAGQATTVAARVPDGPGEGGQTRLTVTVKAVLQAREAELDDAFAAAASPHEDMARLRASLRDRLDRERAADQLRAARDAALAAVITTVGLDPERDESRFAVLDALADAEQIQVSTEELRDVITYELAVSGVSAHALSRYLTDNRDVAVRLYERARREKALIHLLTQIVIKGPDGKPVSFGELARW